MHVFKLGIDYDYKTISSLATQILNEMDSI